MKFLILAPLALFLAQNSCATKAENIICTEGGVVVYKAENVDVSDYGDSDYTIRQHGQIETIAMLRNSHCIVTPYTPPAEQK